MGEGSMHPWMSCSSQDPMWAFWGLVPCSRVHRQGTLAPFLTTRTLPKFCLHRGSNVNPSLLSPVPNRQDFSNFIEGVSIVKNLEAPIIVKDLLPFGILELDINFNLYPPRQWKHETRQGNRRVFLQNWAVLLQTYINDGGAAVQVFVQFIQHLPQLLHVLLVGLK